LAFFAAVTGTLINALTVLAGGLAGTFLGNRLPKRIQESLFGVLGLFTLLVGLADPLSALKTLSPLVLLGALLVGTIIGEAIDIEGWLQRFGDRVQARLAREGSTLSEAFVSSSLVFCVGPLSILGALDNGLNGDITKLAIKSTLDGFGALAFSAALGWGVLLSIGTILIYQGAISLSAGALAPLLNANPQLITALTATGGLILVAIGFKLMKIRDLRPANMLPALLVAPALVALLAFLSQRFGG
jgi:uncharacterized membrane protein YqgA involved in biofilm formation